MRIEFKKKQDGPKEKGINDVRQWLVEFLDANGFINAEGVMGIEGNRITFRPSCSNPDMTKAIGLMLLLFTRNNKELFVGFHKTEGMYIDTKHGGSWQKGYEYLESIGMDVRIEF